LALVAGPADRVGHGRADGGAAGVPVRGDARRGLRLRGGDGRGGGHGHGPLLRRLAAGVRDRPPGEDPGGRPDVDRLPRGAWARAVAPRWRGAGSFRPVFSFFRLGARPAGPCGGGVPPPPPVSSRRRTNFMTQTLVQTSAARRKEYEDQGFLVVRSLFRPS